MLRHLRMSGEVEYRAMKARDAEAVVAVMSAATASLQFNCPLPRPDQTLRERQIGLLEALLTEPRTSAHVAAIGNRLVGMGVAIRQSAVWGLSTLFVSPECHGLRIGSTLLARTREGNRDASFGLITSSHDPKAIRAYSRLGFELIPAMGAAGNVDLALLPAPPHVATGGRGDLGIVAEVDQRLRSGSRASAAGFLLDQGAELLVAESGSARGFAVHLGGRPLFDGSPLILGADTQQLAEELFTAMLRATVGAPVAVYFLTHRQQWALRLAMRAGLDLFQMSPTFSYGYTALPQYWIPSGVFF